MPFSPLEFHLTKLARDTYAFDRDLVQFRRPDLAAVQELALRLNQHGKTVRPSDLFAVVLLQQIYHRVIEMYVQERQPRLFDLASGEVAEQVPEHFGSAFPPLDVYQARTELRHFLSTYSHGRANREALLEQMMLVHVNNGNPACGELKELFDEQSIPAREAYLATMRALRELLKDQPTYGRLGLTLFELLESPFKASPGSLVGQLRFIVEQWGLPFDDELRRWLLLAEDLLKEDESRRGPPGKGFIPSTATWTPPRRGEGDLPEHYTMDTEWMPRAVLIAKSVYVWLDQLSKEYRREVRRLDQIPDEELAKLSQWGFTALWLIGLWERSRASERIKHLHGNIEAAASAYSLYDYTISAELGGEGALENLRGRALNVGIRLACDVVPNHMGIDSRWVMEHPDWFIQLDHPPYPSYRFTGPDLSNEARVSIRLEDGYWNRTDAAVVFERRDNWTGDVRYIYHGNDGTQMPWNDTAQLNFLLPEVRHAVTEQILNVARKFSLIRFDAAMTLTKMHYQRLWFPEPGTGGAIPSRAWHGLTRDDFDRAMPTEFWRDVVDRVNTEKPDTLLLAEAFWLTEGLFVRTLGMHRVYNSAFMNMLKQEKNAEFRQIIKNVLAYDPRILERYVNFMNNPDEDTAIDQFGTDDKYFGVAMMMSTLPGLPMFGHGQIEGYHEKYGHEYRRAYYDEAPNRGLVERHEREIFPLLRRRHLFSPANTFALHDFVTTDGWVNEDVYAYTNHAWHERTLCLYHNRYAETRGWVRQAHDGTGLAGELHLHPHANMYCIYRDLISGLEFLEPSDKLVHEGFYVELRAFAYHVFGEFREVEDREGRYRRVAERLQGRGTASVEREVQRIMLEPLIAAFADFASGENLRLLLRDTAPSGLQQAREFARKARPFLVQAQDFGNGSGQLEHVTEQIESAARSALHYVGRREKSLANENAAAQTQVRDSELRILGGWIAVSQLGMICAEDGAAERGAHWISEWFLGETLADAFVLLGAERGLAEREVLAVRVATAFQNVAQTFHGARRYAEFAEVLDDPAGREFLGVHMYRGVEWFRAEATDELIHLLETITTIRLGMDANLTGKERQTRRGQAVAALGTITEMAALAEYQVGRFRTLLGYAGGRADPTNR
jgi:glycosidase